MSTLSAVALTRPADTREPVRDGDWRDSAACATVPITGDNDPWFPEGRNPSWSAAQRVCSACPVRMTCLETALEEEAGRAILNRHGMRGGLTPTQRYNGHRRTVPRRSPRRDQVVALTNAGKTAAEIAEDMGIDPRVVQDHRRKARALGLLSAVRS